MAYQTVAGSSGGNLKPFAKFQAGESVEGYFAGMTPNKISEDRLDLNFITKDGEEIKVPRAGKLNYLEQDLENSGTSLIIGAMTKLTCTGFYTPKSRNIESPRYSLQQDTSDMREDLTEGGSEKPSSSIQDRINSMKAGK